MKTHLEMAEHAEYIAAYIDEHIPEELRVSVTLAILTGAIVNRYEIDVEPAQARRALRDIPNAIKTILEMTTKEPRQSN